MWVPDRTAIAKSADENHPDKYIGEGVNLGNLSISLLEYEMLVAIKEMESCTHVAVC